MDALTALGKNVNKIHMKMSFMKGKLDLASTTIPDC